MAWEIAHVCRIGWPHVGGMEAFVSGLAAAQAARGHSVRVLTLDRAITDGSALPEGVCRGVPYVRLPRLGPRRYPMGRGMVRAVHGVDLVHVHGLDGHADVLVRTRRLHGARVGVSTHGGYLHTPRHSVLKAIWLRTLTRDTLSRADAVWFTSEADRAALAPAGARGEVLPDGVELERFTDLERRPEAGLWVVIGRVDVHKGLDDLIDALGQVKGRSFRVQIIGPERTPGLIARLQQRARGVGLEGRVVFRGRVTSEEVTSALARCELALFPSRYEGFGIAVVEAMAAGATVVASRIPAHEQLVSDGIHGHLVDFGDPRAAGLFLERVQREAGLEGAARRAASQYGWTRVAEAWERAYSAVLGEVP